MPTNLHRTLVAFTTGVTLLGGCLGGTPTTTSPSGGGKQTGGGEVSTGGTTTGTGTGTGTTTTKTPVDPNQVNLDARVIDYGQAARTASLKLLGELPTADDLATVKDAASYATLIDKYLADPRLARQLLSFFQDEMKVGGPATGTGTKMLPSKDTAPTYAAELVVNDMDFRQIFTGTTNTCPTLDTTTGTFTDAACDPTNGQPAVGVLTDPGVQSAMFSNLGMRRVRWLQETFQCTKFPAEFAANGGVKEGNGLYASPWPFTSVTGGADARVNFQDTSGVICANCHTTMNHIAPLFANFDAQGIYQTTIQVVVPIDKNPTAVLGDWLPAGEALSYRFQQPAPTITDLGAKLAADPATAQCQVARLWNWAMDKGEIVTDAATVPKGTIDTVLTSYTSNGYKLKAALKATFTHADYVKF
ncbi:MAG: hypothetical protein ABI321_15975 [Polyangia bacterium]